MITANLATIPERSESLNDTISSLMPQVDELHIREGHPMGDAGKFVVSRGNYIFRCDDDLIYPPDYVEFMIRKINDYGKKAVVGCHGKVINQQPIESYYGTDFAKYHCLLDVPRDQEVHLVGTGVLAYHRDVINIDISDFKAPNMADIWFSLQCEKQGVKRIVAAHNRGWIKHSDKIDRNKTCWEWNKERDHVLTEAINSIQWQDL